MLVAVSAQPVKALAKSVLRQVSNALAGKLASSVQRYHAVLKLTFAAVKLKETVGNVTMLLHACQVLTNEIVLVTAEKSMTGRVVILEHDVHA